jgi:hypothetical protein
MMINKVVLISSIWEALQIKQTKEKIGIMEIALKELVHRR